MIRYISGRLFQTLPVLFGVSVVVFLLVRFIPGNPATSILGSRATPELVARVRDQFGLDLPVWEQYWQFLGRAIQGDFGISFFYQESVSTLVLQRLPVTIELILLAALMSLILSIPFATLAALKKDTTADHITRLVFAAALGIPSFWLGLVLALLLSVQIRIFPSSGQGSGGLDTLWHLTLPAFTIALSISPMLVRALRSSLIEVMASDYVTTAVASGLKPRQIVVSYMLRNSLLPLITIFGINVGWLIGGTVIVEQVFGLPGVGSLLLNSITTRDYAVIQLATLVFALLVLIVNLLTDLAYVLFDPRVSLAS